MYRDPIKWLIVGPPVHVTYWATLAAAVIFLIAGILVELQRRDDLLGAILIVLGFGCAVGWMIFSAVGITRLTLFEELLLLVGAIASYTVRLLFWPGT